MPVWRLAVSGGRLLRVLRLRLWVLRVRRLSLVTALFRRRRVRRRAGLLRLTWLAGLVGLVGLVRLVRLVRVVVTHRGCSPNRLIAVESGAIVC